MSSCLLLEATYCQASPRLLLCTARTSLPKCLLSTQELLTRPQVLEQVLKLLFGMTTLIQLLLLQCQRTASTISRRLAHTSGTPFDSHTLFAGDADCYDAVTGVMGIVVVVMAIVVMGGAAYIGHCWSLIGRISGIPGSCCCNCCIWFLCGPWALHKETVILEHCNSNEGVSLGPTHDSVAV